MLKYFIKSKIIFCFKIFLIIVIILEQICNYSQENKIIIEWLETNVVLKNTHNYIEQIKNPSICSINKFGQKIYE
jgi:hypothetical protein